MCSHCGQLLPAGYAHAHAPGYGEQRVNRTGIAVTVLLHLLLLALFLLRPPEKKPSVLPPGGAIAYITPPKPKAERPEPPKAAPKKTRPQPVKKSAPPRVDMARLPDTITLPAEPPPPPPKPEVEPEPSKMAKVDPAEDMTAMIEARRRARGQSEQLSEESDAERGNRLARANIAAANGRKSGQGGADGAFSVSDQSFNTAQVKLNTKFLGSTRPSLKQERADLGNERDIETAVVKKLIEMLRRENFIDFNFTSQRLGRSFPMSTRPEHRAELEAVLLRELYPDYRPPRR